MKYLTTPLWKTAAIVFFTMLLIATAPLYVHFITEVDLFAWAGLEIQEDNQALVKLFLTMIGGMILLYWPINSAFKDEDRLILLIFFYLASVLTVAVLVELGVSALSESILWQLSVFGNSIAAVFLFTKYYFLAQDREEEY